MEAEQLLRSLWWQGVDAVLGDRAVQHALEKRNQRIQFLTHVR